MVAAAQSAEPYPAWTSMPMTRMTCGSWTPPPALSGQARDSAWLPGSVLQMVAPATCAFTAAPNGAAVPGRRVRGCSAAVTRPCSTATAIPGRPRSCAGRTDEAVVSRIAVGGIDRVPPGRRRVSYEENLLATTLTFARRHRPVWSWRRWRRTCRCGVDLPCRARHRIPINRGHWPGEDAQ